MIRAFALALTIFTTAVLSIGLLAWPIQPSMQNVGPSPTKAADVVTGIWVAEELGPLVFELRTSGSQLSGFARLQNTVGPLMRTPVFDGRIDGEAIRFKYHNSPGTSTIALTGTVLGDEIRFTSQVQNAVEGAGTGARGGIAPQFVVTRATTIPNAPVQQGRGGPGGPGGGVVQAKPIIKPGAIVVAGVVNVDEGYPRPVFQFAMTDVASGQRFTPDVDPRNGSGSFGPATITVGSRLPEFSIQLPPGDYRATVSGLPTGYSVKSMRSGTADLLTGRLNIDGGSGPETIAIVFGATSGQPWVRVSGRVVNASTRRIAVALPRGNSRDGSLALADSIMLVGSAFSENMIVPLGADGSFVFPQVLPGTYTVRVLPETLATFTAGSNKLPIAATTNPGASPTYQIVVGAAGLTNVDVLAPTVIGGTIITVERAR